MNIECIVLSELGEAAVDYARRGWPVFPIMAGHKGEGIPGYSNTHYLPRGHLNASKRPEQVRSWWERWPNANIGLSLAEAGLVAIDADTYKPDCGWHGFIRGRDLPATLVQRSARGGTHYIFKATEGAAYQGKLCAGVDIKHNGYILLAPSVFEDNEYQWETDDEPADAPDWLPKKSEPKTNAYAAPVFDRDISDLSKVQNALRAAENTLDRADWVRLAFGLKHLLGDSGESDWLDFSTRYPGEQKPGEALRVWRTAKPDGSVAAGTIFHLLTPLAVFPTPRKLRLRSFHDLQRLTFPPINWVVPGFLSEGLTILAGAPKVGKSWLMLDMARAVATGTDTLGQTCEQGDVLLLALEDNDRRLQDRLKRIAGEADWATRSQYATSWPRLDASGLQEIINWIDTAQNPRLIIIDTWAMVKPPPKGRSNSAYDHDVAALKPLHNLASERRIAIVVVTHIRKMDADDPIERVSSTMGLTGVADTIATLLRGPGGVGHVLYARGRDIAEFERAIKLVNCRWEVQGDPLEVFARDTRKAIFKALREGATTPKEIEAACELSGPTIRKTLERMVKRGDVTKSGRGEYAPATTVTK